MVWQVALQGTRFFLASTQGAALSNRVGLVNHAEAQTKNHRRCKNALGCHSDPPVSCLQRSGIGKESGIPQMTRRLDDKPRSIWPVWVGRAMGKDTHTLDCASTVSARGAMTLC